MSESMACRLENRGVIRIGGAGRRAFLQGLVSNDIELCKPGHAIYAALLTPQGKFLHDMLIVDDGDAFLLDCEAARAEDLLERLTMHKLRAKVELADANGQFDVWTFWSRNSQSTSFRRKPESREPVSSDNRKSLLDSGFRQGDAFFYDDPRLNVLGGRAIMKKSAQPAGFNVVDFTAYDTHRLALGVPDGSRDMIIEKSTLADGNFDLLNGVSFTKGCYMGQELTARMHHRALVKKRMFPVGIDGPLPAFGAAITLGGDEIGDMRSGCENIGLALLNIEKARMAIETHTPLACGAAKLQPCQPEWMKL